MNMLKNKARVKKAQDIALERLDYVINCIEALDFVEVIGRMGDDTITYRVYYDGSKYERQEYKKATVSHQKAVACSYGYASFIVSKKTSKASLHCFLES